jgi:oligopeptide/dipeptide ABC transporter ATP-binding protein
MTTELATKPGGLRIRDLEVGLRRGGNTQPILAGVNLEVNPGEAVGLVGESGSGKSTTARAVLGLFPERSVVSGGVEVGGRSVLDLERRALQAFRSHEVGMIYQNPRARVNPLRKVGDFMTEAMIDSGVSRAAARQRATGLLQAVAVPDAARRLDQYPGDLSGGLLQRVVIATVMASGPRLVLADEPTSALDVTTQEEVVAILGKACQERDMALLFITHDLDLAAAVTDKVVVIYAGRVVENLPSRLLHAHPRHPYTVGLLRSRPSLTTRERIRTIPGTPIAAYEAGPGCVFAPRCPLATDICLQIAPELRRVGDSVVACHNAEEVDRPNSPTEHR